MTFRDDLQCEVVRLEYDFRAMSGRLYMPAGQCCDMSGCIALFKKIDLRVELIETFAGIERDTSYGLEDGVWQAFKAPAQLRQRSGKGSGNP